MAGIYDTPVLVGVVRTLIAPQSFLLDTFFPNVVESDAEEVAVDVEIGSRRLAPFCSPLVEGKVVQARGFTTNIFKPAYIKDKRTPDLLRPVRRAIGERIGGSLAPAEREAANIAFEMADQVAMITRRLEWMAASALRSGTVTITGEGYPTVVVNFQRDSGNTVVLTGGARWGQAGVSPTANLDTWSLTMLQKSGITPTDVVFTPSAWTLFRSDPLVGQSIASPNQTDASITLGGGVQLGAQYKGTWGTYRLWVYNDWYVDPVDGVEKPMLPDGTVLLVGQQMQGTRHFGCIKDPAFNYGALAFAPKTWVQQDPAQRFLMMQSAPIVVPFRPNATFAATVI